MAKKNKEIFKTFRTEVKAVDEKEGIIDMLIPMSTDSVDRANESIDPMGWVKSLPAFKKRAILVSSHSYSDLRKQIGELVDIKAVKEGLLAKPKYYINQGNEEADWAFKLASKGMAAYSVGFIPVKWVDGDGKKGPYRKYTEQELLEISHVIVPCNRDSIQDMKGKSENPIEIEIMEEILKSDFIENTVDVVKVEEKEKYDCECIDCGYKMTSDKHCKEIKCPECGGTMRRVERPGPGEDSKILETRKEVEESIEKNDADVEEAESRVDNILKIYEMVKENKELKEKLEAVEIKAGAVLNAKNKSNLKNAQALIQSVLDSAGTTEEDSLVIDDNKNDKGEDDGIDIVTDTVDNIVTDEEDDEAREELEFKANIEAIVNQSITDNKKYFKDSLDYVLGRVSK